MKNKYRNQQIQNQFKNYKMKKLFYLFCLVVLLGISGNVMGQSKGNAPAPGATHTYSVVPNTGSNYLWFVTKNGVSADAGGDAVLSATTGESITITWKNTLVESTDYYYVHVVETANGCKNEKVMPVKIVASPFYVTIAAANLTDCWDAPVTVVETGTSAAPAVAYNHGTATVDYTVTPHGTSAAHAGYTFSIALPLDAAYTAVPSILSGAATISNGVVTVTDNNPVTISYSVTRTNLTDGTDATGDQADFTAIATVSNGLYNGISDNGTDPKSGKTVVSRPHTPSIITN